MTQQPGERSADFQLGDCPHCGERVPAGAFCGNCGQVLGEPERRGRLHAYAASPGEHVMRPALISTLFPHLAHRHANLFREAFGVGVLVVILLAALRLYTSALIAAAVLLPILYLLYLYEVEVYEEQPAAVVLATFVAGAALGTGYQLVSAHFSGVALSGTVRGPLVSGVVQPVIAQLLMLLGPLLLLSRSEFDEPLDGLTFGVTSALGFTLAAVLTGYWHTFTEPLQGTGAVSAQEVLRLLRAGILVALVNSCTTATITTMLWADRYAGTPRRRAGGWRGRNATIALAFATQVALALGSYYVGSLLGLVLLWAFAAVVLLVWLRVLLHHALLDEGVELHIGDVAPCPECHRMVPAMRFCPACGMHRGAARKQDRVTRGDTGMAPSHG